MDEQEKQELLEELEKRFEQKYKYDTPTVRKQIYKAVFD